MTKGQKIISIFGGILLLLALIFPPTYSIGSYHSHHNNGFEFIAYMSYDSNIEYPQWVIELLVIAGATIFCYSIFKKK